MARRKTTTSDQEEKELISVIDYAGRMGVSRQTVYKRLLTLETPEGDIVPDLVDNKWRIDWNKYKTLTFSTAKRRTKVPPGLALNSKTK